MRQAIVRYKGEKAGYLTQHDDGKFSYRYIHTWIVNDSKPPISLTLMQKNKVYQADHLFPVFYHLLPEGANKQVISQYMRIDEDDDFGLLLGIAHHDTIGAISIEETDEAG